MPTSVRLRRGTVVTTAAVVMASLLAACSGSRAETVTGPTVPVRLAPTTTTTTVVSYDVPVVIDQAYVQKVVGAYDKALGDAIRVLVRDGGISEEFLKYLVGLYSEEEFGFQQRAWRESLSKGDLEHRPVVPGNPVTTVFTLAEASPRCVIARADRDRRPTLTVEPEESPQDNYLVLVAKKPDRDPLAINPTPWVMSFDGFKNDNTVPRNSCDD